MMDRDAIRRRALLEVREGEVVFLGPGLPDALDLASRGARRHMGNGGVEVPLAIVDAETADAARHVRHGRLVILSLDRRVRTDLRCDRWIGPLGVVDFGEGQPVVVEVPAGVSGKDVQEATLGTLYALSSLSPLRTE